MGDAVVHLQELREDEKVFREETLVAQVEQHQLIKPYVIQGHETAVDGEVVNAMINDKFGQVLETEVADF